ncbi:MAG: DUF433 domain-containing protein [Gammaproteobacteria bacterium]|nr:DUF433 domain-containing protein [Gammaproteobacteria bacterium]
MDWQNGIEIDPHILTGKPVIKGTRLAAEFILELLANGWSEKELMDNYPGLTTENIRVCLGYASAVLQSERAYPAAAKTITDKR